jgi:DNA-binding response OmpR family regulator
MLKLKILIIDDEVDYCTIMKSYFVEKNYEVYCGYTLGEGLEILDKICPDILFLDNNLPDGKGWLHVAEIGEKFPALRIYLVSAYHQKGDFPGSSNVIVWEKPLSIQLLNSTF